MKRYVLEVVVFVCGAAVMVFELTGSRVLAPYMGTSIFVWSSLIGVILGSLSLGYWWGGRIADRRPTPPALSLIILGAAVLIAAASAGKTALLRFFFFHLRDPRGCSLLSSLVLFAPASVLLGMVSPYAARLRMRALDASGRTVGNLYAISTVGSITGTFLAGFFLIPRFGSTVILFMIAGTLLAAAILLSPRGRLAVRGAAVALIALFAAVHGRTKSLQIETQYNSVMIGEAPHPPTGRTIRIMALNSQDSSAMFVDGDDLVHDYTKYYGLAEHFRPGLRSALMLGGAAYSYPRHFVARYPEAAIDVVEIDPRVTDLAREYFRLTDHPRLRITHEDGRIFLNETRKKYDVFFGDAFQSRFSVPFHLTTREAAGRVHDLLEDGGVAILNTICSIEGKEGKFLRALHATWSEVFPQVYLFPVEDATNGRLVQNVMVVALKSTEAPTFQSEDPVLNEYLGHRWTGAVARDVAILTDDHAPVEYYLGAASVAR